ncbi:MAG: hypothetical protein ACQKBW_10320 [Puniceicoccales bacterium]
MKRVLAITSRNGQFGNRLQAAAYALSAACEYNAEARLFCLEGYEKQLRNWANKPLRKILNKLQRKALTRVSRSKLLQRLLSCRVLEGTNQHPLILSSPQARDTIRQSRLTIVTGYYIYADPRLLLKHRERIGQTLALNTSATDLEVISHMRADKQTVLVGMHIRRTDYKEYNNGEYYYPISQYESLAHSIAQDAAPAAVRFVICSDEEISQGAFEGLDWRPGPGTAVGDMQAMAHCDYLLGPPSTFNRWSAFIGAVPRYEIHKSDTQVQLSDFRLQEDLTYPGDWRASPPPDHS